ncbi:MAG: hypothetical protein GY772_06950 [bacterium]|nr:hypothetical protein [bacterium]
MMLYDVIYGGASSLPAALHVMDCGTRLPRWQRYGRRVQFVAVAVNVNGDGHSLYCAGRRWRQWAQLSAPQQRRLRRAFPGSSLLPQELS